MALTVEPNPATEKPHSSFQNGSSSCWDSLWSLPSWSVNSTVPWPMLAIPVTPFMPRDELETVHSSVAPL
jgi:hypothetical protein